MQNIHFKIQILKKVQIYNDHLKNLIIENSLKFVVQEILKFLICYTEIFFVIYRAIHIFLFFESM